MDARPSPVTGASALLDGRLGTIYQEQRRWLLQWFRRRVFNIDQAADYVQDTFVKVLAAGTADHLENPRAYLTVVARQLLVDERRHASLESAYLSLLAAEPAAVAPSEETRAIHLETLRLLDQALAEMPLAVRAVMLMAQVEGMSQQLIASELGISERTVRRHLTRALTACLTIANE